MSEPGWLDIAETLADDVLTNNRLSHAERLDIAAALTHAGELIRSRPGPMEGALKRMRNRIHEARP